MTLDEYGSGAPFLPNLASPLTLIAPPFPVGYTITNDPLSGITTLRYTLRDANQTAGDLYLTDPNGGGMSDIIRFDGQGHVFFFSLEEPGQTSFSLADVPNMPSLQAPKLGQVEVAPQDQIGNLFTPAFGQPGFDPQFGGALGYNIISDVPEPSSFLLGGLGAMFWASKTGRRAKRESWKTLRIGGD
jgi:hypothetical protein